MAHVTSANPLLLFWRNRRGIRPDGRPVWDLPWTVGPLNRKLRAQEQIYNTLRPHQSPGYRTPPQYLRGIVHAGKPSQCVTNVLNEYTGSVVKDYTIAGESPPWLHG